MADTQRIHGLDDVLRKLKALPPAVSGKNGGPVLKALRAGGRVIASEAQSNLAANANETDAYVNTGALIKAVGVTRKRRPGGGAKEGVAVLVRKRKYADGTKTVAAARWLEFGSENQTAKPFMAPAFLSKKEEALTAVVSTLTREIDRAIKKLSR